jgi:hypothetical protein
MEVLRNEHGSLRYMEFLDAMGEVCVSGRRAISLRLCLCLCLCLSVFPWSLPCLSPDQMIVLKGCQEYVADLRTDDDSDGMYTYVWTHDITRVCLIAGVLLLTTLGCVPRGHADACGRWQRQHQEAPDRQ